LYWKNEHDVSVSDSSDEDNTIFQEEPKAAPLATSNMEASIDEAAGQSTYPPALKTTHTQTHDMLQHH
jgi:hypothetical protein